MTYDSLDYDEPTTSISYAGIFGDDSWSLAQGRRGADSPSGEAPSRDEASWWFAFDAMLAVIVVAVGTSFLAAAVVTCAWNALRRAWRVQLRRIDA